MAEERASGATSQATNEATSEAIESFIARWSASDADEQANAQPFLSELCDIIGVPRPDVATSTGELDNYAFEKRVSVTYKGEQQTVRRIDLYRRGCFVLEAKQGRRPEATSGRFDDKAALTKAGTAIRGTAAYGDAMERAFRQARDYARALPSGEEWPPFLIIVDIGYSIELYADFTRSGRDWLHFPDPSHSRVFLEDLRDPAVRDLLRAVWLDPRSLDPAARSAKVTRHIAGRLAKLAVSLEEDGHDTEVAAHFLMRCLFCMFAEDAGLLPEDAFTGLLRDAHETPAVFSDLMASLFGEMDRGGFSASLRTRIRRFNGGLFAVSPDEPAALPLAADQIGLLMEAAEADWREVEPAIFGTLLERALDPRERHKLGAHYTPREYVERLVVPTVMEPLREEWDAARAAASQLENAGDVRGATDTVRKFHRKLCDVRVLDPACGSGNFLYVTLAQMKRLEAEVLRRLDELDHAQFTLEMEGFRVNPSQFLGIEINPRAAAVADLVLWIGYLQWQLSTDKAGGIPEPVLQAFGNIECRDALIDYDEVRQKLDEHGNPITRWDGVTTKTHPVTGEQVPDDSAQAPVVEYVNPRKAAWPEADFIVGNPPFLGNKRMREGLGDGYVEAIRGAIPSVSSAADFVMYWWHRAASCVVDGSCLRAGLIATNSLSQIYQRAVLEEFVGAGNASIVFGVPDHPWVDDATSAAVRVSMVVMAAGEATGSTWRVVEASDSGARADKMVRVSTGRIGVDMRLRSERGDPVALDANRSLSYMGVTLVGQGFVVGEDFLAPSHEGDLLKPYVTGGDLTRVPTNRRVIDFHGLSTDEARAIAPALYQRVLHSVRPKRMESNRDAYREKWWLHAEAREGMRAAIAGLNRYIVTCRTAKHRTFQFVNSPTLPESTVIVLAVSDAFFLGVLSSRMHLGFALAAGGTLEDRPRYNNSVCFDPFPFPDPDEAARERIRALAEELDAHRKRQQAQHEKLTLTAMYNVLEKLRSGEALTAKDKTIHEQGLVGVLQQLHDELDAAVADAYGWPRDLSDEEILERLVELNHERAEEEKRGLVRWLRPEFQNPDAEPAATQTSVLLDEEDEGRGTPKAAAKKGKVDAVPWPESLADRTHAIMQELRAASGPLDAEDLGKRFKRAPRAQVSAILETLVRIGFAREVEGGVVVD